MLDRTHNVSLRTWGCWEERSVLNTWYKFMFWLKNSSWSSDAPQTMFPTQRISGVITWWQSNVDHIHSCAISLAHHTTPHHNRYMALFTGPPGWAGARRELLDFMVQGKINRGRYTDHLAGRHSIRTNQCPPPASPIFTGRMPFLPPNQQCQSTEGN